MKAQRLLFILPAFLLITTVYGQETNTQKFKKLAWLTGKWIRTNSKPGQSGYEIWEKVTAVKLIGKGVTRKGKETIFLEELELITKGNDIFYGAKVSAEEKPVYFKLTAIDSNGFTCENALNEFPKKITYKRTGKKVKAVISGGGKSVDYEFVAE